VKLRPFEIPGVYLVEAEPAADERGFFARLYCREEFGRYGLNPAMVQCSLSYNRLKGTLRGMHYQVEPRAEAKLVRCARGRVYDVVLDLRPGSPTYRRWIAADLHARGHAMMYVPEGCAHGFQTLEDDTEVLYLISEFYSPEQARGVRWNDPTFDIDWPLDVSVISPKDRSYPDVGP
jgi:dTDP-4-dehydrorhamnose 3,5-epimerase